MKRIVKKSFRLMTFGMVLMLTNAQAQNPNVTKLQDKDLIETPENGVATIMPDEFLNVYDKTGPGMTIYKP